MGIFEVKKKNKIILSASIESLINRKNRELKKQIKMFTT